MPAPAAQMGVAKSDFSQMHWSRSDLIMNVKRFTQIDLDRSRFEKECNQYETILDQNKQTHYHTHKHVHYTNSRF